MMNTCSEVRALLPLAVGDDLAQDQAAGVADHLAGGCAECSEALRELTRVRGHLLELPQRSPAPAVDLWPGVRTALLEEGLLQRGGVVIRRARFGARGAWLSTAAATLLVAGALWSLRRGADPVAPNAAGGEVAAEVVVEQGVSPTLAPTLAGGPAAGGLRPLAPGETPFALEAEEFGPQRVLIPIVPGGEGVDVGRPKLAGDRGGK
ncbi:MAG TPA: hypothetical protein VMT18_15710 [Planctomycetota bacterium]|nr:hypothetical protein [Planctomycetota bacterium]